MRKKISLLVCSFVFAFSFFAPTIIAQAQGGSPGTLEQAIRKQYAAVRGAWVACYQTYDSTNKSEVRTLSFGEGQGGAKISKYNPTLKYQFKENATPNTEVPVPAYDGGGNTDLFSEATTTCEGLYKEVGKGYFLSNDSSLPHMFWYAILNEKQFVKFLQDVVNRTPASSQQEKVKALLAPYFNASTAILKTCWIRNPIRPLTSTEMAFFGVKNFSELTDQEASGFFSLEKDKIVEGVIKDNPKTLIYLNCVGQAAKIDSKILEQAYGVGVEDPTTVDPNVEVDDVSINQDADLLDDCKMPAAWDIKNWIPGALDWFGCTVAKAMIGVVESISSALEKVLATEDLSENSSVRQVWRNFLTIANILFVIAFLLMIISTALNLGIFNAYTIKKLLPRIIIAVILANLSLPLMGVVIKITNALGQEMSQLILGPVSGLPAGATDIGAGAGAAIATALSAAITALVVSVATGSVFVLVPAVMTAVFALLVGVVVVIIRRIIILLLVVVAPIAIALWIIPGTEGWAKRWYKTFIQMLFMYPIIMAMIAAGQFTALLILNSAKSGGSPDANPGFFEGLSALLAIVLPLFLLPTIFKLASSTLSNITGMLNNKGKGIFDKGANWGRDRAGKTGAALRKAERKNLTDQSKHHSAAHSVYESLDKKPGGLRGIQHKFRTRNISDQVARTAQLKYSQDELQQAQYASKANGGIDGKRQDGKSKHFLVETTDGKKIMVGKDAAVAHAWQGAKVSAVKDTYDKDGNFTGYDRKDIQGVLFDGSEASQRAAGQIAGSQALAPVVDAVRNGDNTSWYEVDDMGEDIGKTTVQSFAQQYTTGRQSGNAKMVKAAERSNAVLGEVKDGYAGQLSSKMPSFVKGNALAFEGVQADSLSKFHENEVGRMVKYVAELADSGEPEKVAKAGETWARIGQSVKQIVEKPEHYNMSPKALQQLKQSYDSYAGSVAPAAGMDALMARINSDGTLN